MGTIRCLLFLYPHIHNKPTTKECPILNQSSNPNIILNSKNAVVSPKTPAQKFFANPRKKISLQMPLTPPQRDSHQNDFTHSQSIPSAKCQISSSFHHNKRKQTDYRRYTCQNDSKNDIFS